MGREGSYIYAVFPGSSTLLSYRYTPRQQNTRHTLHAHGEFSQYCMWYSLKRRGTDRIVYAYLRVNTNNKQFKKIIIRIGYLNLNNI